MDIPPAFSDIELQEKTTYLVKKYNIVKIYETGTYKGESAYILSNMFPNVKVYSYEIDSRNYDTAKIKNANKTNVTLRKISSPEGLKMDLVEGENNVLFFLDAHWYDYWPLLDELGVIISKKIKPCVLIHDFYVPDEKGNAKFQFDSYLGHPLNFEYIRKQIELIYESNYDYFYSKNVTINSGIIYIHPK
jgi:hypothetical protein